MLQSRQLNFRPSRKPGILSPVTVRSTGHYRFSDHLEENNPRNFTQIFWVAGRGPSYLRAGEWHQTQTGDTFFYKAGETHCLRAGKDGCDYYWMTFDGELIGDWLHQQFPDATPRKTGKCPIRWFEELKEIISLPTIATEQEAACLGFRVLMKFASATDISVEDASSREEDFCQKLEHLIQIQYKDPDFGIKEAAHSMNVHRTSLFRIYRDCRGMTPSAYLQRMRLRHGLKLLRHSDLNITEVALASGYRDANYFSKVIRHSTGETPKEIGRQR